MNWKHIKTTQFRDYYVSDTGIIKSVSKRTGNEKILKPHQMLNNYLTTNIGLVHRLVATAFVPNLENKPQVDHIDGNRQNNNASNLRWCTQVENLNFTDVQQRKSDALRRAWTPEKRAALSAKNKGRKHSAEWNQHISEGVQRWHGSH